MTAHMVNYIQTLQDLCNSYIPGLAQVGNEL